MGHCQQPSSPRRWRRHPKKSRKFPPSFDIFDAFFGRHNQNSLIPKGTETKMKIAHDVTELIGHTPRWYGLTGLRKAALPRWWASWKARIPWPA